MWEKKLKSKTTLGTNRVYETKVTSEKRKEGNRVERFERVIQNVKGGEEGGFRAFLV